MDEKGNEYIYCKEFYHPKTTNELLRLVARMIEFPDEVIIEDSIEKKELVDDILWGSTMLRPDIKHSILYENSDFEILGDFKSHYYFRDRAFFGLIVIYKYKINNPEEIEKRRALFNFKNFDKRYEFIGINLELYIENVYRNGEIFSKYNPQSAIHLGMKISSLDTIGIEKCIRLASNQSFLERIAECGLEVIKGEVLCEINERWINTYEKGTKER